MLVREVETVRTDVRVRMLPGSKAGLGLLKDYGQSTRVLDIAIGSKPKLTLHEYI
jgi:hypothetical protein